MTDIDRKNYLYAKRKMQVARLALDGDWQMIRRILDHIESEQAGRTVEYVEKR